MNARIINHTIKEMCGEISDSKKFKNWNKMSEENLFKEMAMCIFSSQLRFEIAEAIAHKLHKKGFFKISKENLNRIESYESEMIQILSETITLNLDGKRKDVLPRFKNRWTKLVANTVRNIYLSNLSIKGILLEASCPLDARRLLVKHVSGFGPKQASLYLRRVGYCSDMAVIDTHIIDYLALSQGVNVKQSSLSSLSFYETTEVVFKNIAKDFGYPVGAVDLATWITMRVVKREGMLCHL